MNSRSTSGRGNVEVGSSSKQHPGVLVQGLGELHRLLLGDGVSCRPGGARRDRSRRGRALSAASPASAASRRRRPPVGQAGRGRCSRPPRATARGSAPGRSCGCRRAARPSGRGNADARRRGGSCRRPGISAPERIFTSVDLPAPFCPASAWMVPRLTVKLTPLSAWTPRIALGDAVEPQLRQRRRGCLALPPPLRWKVRPGYGRASCSFIGLWCGTAGHGAAPARGLSLWRVRRCLGDVVFSGVLGGRHRRVVSM